jgi:hypothetical protein
MQHRNFSVIDLCDNYVRAAITLGQKILEMRFDCPRPCAIPLTWVWQLLGGELVVIRASTFDGSRIWSNILLPTFQRDLSWLESARACSMVCAQSYLPCLSSDVVVRRAAAQSGSGLVNSHVWEAWRHCQVLTMFVRSTDKHYRCCNIKSCL